ncbi:MAG: permease prefix domain 2-containing transporter, partial [Bacteroidota bacterium]
MKGDTHFPPRWADRFLEWYCDESLLEEIQGDLHEAYYERLETYGKPKADRLFIVDVIKFCKPYAFEKYSTLKQFLPMLQNYLKIGLRNILHRQGFTAINLAGLSIGIAAVMLVGMYWNSENTYDTTFPENENIYRLMNKYRDQTYTCMKFSDYFQSSQEVEMRLINRLKEYEGVTAACHFVPSESAIGGRDQFYIEIDDSRYLGDNLLYLSSGKDFQSIFPMEFLRGSAEQAFGALQTITITDRLANRWFGASWKELDLVGKSVTIRDEGFVLAGVVEALPGNVHFDFDII